MIGTITYLISIGRRGGFVEEFHDRGKIEPRSWHIWREIVATIAANWGATLVDDRGHHQAPTTGSNAPKNWAKNSLYKAMYSPFENQILIDLWSKLSKFRGRSLGHRDPPAFRLDCEAIGEGLITNFSLISLNFSLEFWTSTRKNPSKFASIHENWSPILAEIGLVRFDRLSGGNLSFY